MDPMSAKVHSIMKELHRQLSELYGSRLVRMVLYGSQSRGDAERGSDIDVLVVLEGPVSPGVEIAEPVTTSPRSLLRTAWCSRAHLFRQIGSSVNRAPFL